MKNCNKCVYKEKAEKFFYCEECSTCTNGENEDTNNNFKSKMLIIENEWGEKHEEET